MTLAVFLVSPVGHQYDLGGVPGLARRESYDLGGIPGLTCREPV
jgi:hypothetical protein